MLSTPFIYCFIKVAHVGTNQQPTCVYIPWHKSIALTKHNGGDHGSAFVECKIHIEDIKRMESSCQNNIFYAETSIKNDSFSMFQFICITTLLL